MKKKKKRGFFTHRWKVLQPVGNKYIFGLFFLFSFRLRRGGIFKNNIDERPATHFACYLNPKEVVRS